MVNFKKGLNEEKSMRVRRAEERHLSGGLKETESRIEDD